MISVEIKNFQAIDELKLQIEGFTALVGRTNIGKSSIVRAINCALSGGSGSDFVRHDALKCARVLRKVKTCDCAASVKLTFAKGQSLLWEKGGKGLNRYTVCKDGVEQVYDRVGQSVEVSDFVSTQLAPIKFGPSQTLLQVSSQFEIPFLLDLSGTTVADILSEVGQLDAINQAMSLAAKDRRTSVATRKVRENDIQSLTGQLAVYLTLDDHLKGVQALVEQRAALRALEQRAGLATRLYTEVIESIKQTRRLAQALEPVLPDALGIQTAAQRVKAADGFIVGWDARASAIEALSKALRPSLPDSEALSVTARRWHKAASFEGSWLEREKLVERLGKVEGLKMPLLAPLQTHVASLAKLARWLKALGDAKLAFDKSAQLRKLPLPVVDPLTTTVQSFAKVDQLVLRQTRLEEELSRDEKALEAVDREASEVLAEFTALGLCPTCHQGISPEHVVHV